MKLILILIFDLRPLVRIQFPKLVCLTFSVQYQNLRIDDVSGSLSQKKMITRIQTIRPINRILRIKVKQRVCVQPLTGARDQGEGLLCTVQCTANEGPVRIQYKCLVPNNVFPETKLRSLVISKPK